MKKLSILSLMFAVTLSFVLASCGGKKDEALVAEYNAKKMAADSLMKVMDNGSKMMMTDDAAWSAKLDDAGKAGADAAKIADFKAQMKKMEDMGKAPDMTAMMDSLHAAMNMKAETNDQMKAAIASMDAAMSKCNMSCNMMMDSHKKLGTDITAFLGGGAAPAKEEGMKEMSKKPAEKGAPAASGADVPAVDPSKHPVKVAPGKHRGDASSSVKQ
jgi:hypothetical protein